MNWTHLLGLVLCIGFAVGIPWALDRDRLDVAEYHLMHGPNTGCVECEGK